MTEWINIKNRLPRLNEEVLVYVEGLTYDSRPYKNIQISYLNEFYGKNMEVESINFICISSSHEIVTYWMPLPEPPKDD